MKKLLVIGTILPLLLLLLSSFFALNFTISYYPVILLFSIGLASIVWVYLRTKEKHQKVLQRKQKQFLEQQLKIMQMEKELLQDVATFDTLLQNGKNMFEEQE